MGFFSKLLGRDAWKKTLVRDLAVLTAVDGDMDKDEVAFAFKIATNELGFTEQKFVALMQNLGDVQDIYPDERQDKLAYLEYLLQLTYVDGYVDDNEIEYMKVVAQRMNLPTSAIDRAIEYVESVSEDTSSYNDENANDFPDDAGSIKTVLTSPYDTVPEVQSEEGIRHYQLRISKLSRVDLCIELSNVMAAKHNLMLMPASPNEFVEKQAKVTDLTDKAVIICMHEFGQEVVMNYTGMDLRKFNELVITLDEKLAQENLHPEQHGKKLLLNLSQFLTR